jgi:hypothetical protein
LKRNPIICFVSIFKRNFNFLLYFLKKFPIFLPLNNFSPDEFDVDFSVDNNGTWLAIVPEIHRQKEGI